MVKGNQTQIELTVQGNSGIDKQATTTNVVVVSFLLQVANNSYKYHTARTYVRLYLTNNATWDTQ
jgi:hypothetical protein